MWEGLDYRTRPWSILTPDFIRALDRIPTCCFAPGMADQDADFPSADGFFHDIPLNDLRETGMSHNVPIADHRPQETHGRRNNTASSDSLGSAAHSDSNIHSGSGSGSSSARSGAGSGAKGKRSKRRTHVPKEKIWRRAAESDSSEDGSSKSGSGSGSGSGPDGREADTVNGEIFTCGVEYQNVGIPSPRPCNYRDIPIFNRLVNIYGTHVIEGVTMGGSIRKYYTMDQEFANMLGAANPDAKMRSSIAQYEEFIASGEKTISKSRDEGLRGDVMNQKSNAVMDWSDLTEKRVNGQMSDEMPAGVSNSIKFGVVRKETKIIGGSLSPNMRVGVGELNAKNNGKDMKKWIDSAIERPGVIRYGLASIADMVMHPDMTRYYRFKEFKKTQMAAKRVRGSMAKVTGEDITGVKGAETGQLEDISNWRHLQQKFDAAHFRYTNEGLVALDFRPPAFYDGTPQKDAVIDSNKIDLVDPFEAKGKDYLATQATGIYLVEKELGTIDGAGKQSKKGGDGQGKEHGKKHKEKRRRQRRQLLAYDGSLTLDEEKIGSTRTMESHANGTPSQHNKVEATAQSTKSKAPEAPKVKDDSDDNDETNAEINGSVRGGRGGEEQGPGLGNTKYEKMTPMERKKYKKAKIEQTNYILEMQKSQKGDMGYMRNIHYQGDPTDGRGNEWRHASGLILKKYAIANYLRWAFAKVEMMEFHLREKEKAAYMVDREVGE